MIQLIDNLLDRITMYRLMLYYLIALIGAAVGLSLFGYLHYSPLAIAFSAGYLSIICWLTNKVFAYVFEAPVNVESALITALILTLVVTPPKTAHDIVFLTAVAGLAMASKFILAINKKHIFNPAAVAVALMAIGPGQAASWWVGSLAMLPFVCAGGILIVRKIRRGHMVMSYFAAAMASTIVVNALTHHHILANLQRTAFHSPLFFLALVMLTEPLTSPATKTRRTWYAVLTGLLFPPQIRLFNIYSTPELSLLIGNVFSYLVSPKLKIFPTLTKKVAIAPNIFDFTFKPERPLSFKPGQYMEWTLPHGKPDSRGNRRYFTLASSPTEDNIRLGVKFYPQGSSYKKALQAMDSQTPIAAGQLGGDFVLPDDRSRKLVFIAGGIGVTPYRSMIKYLLDTKDLRVATLLYAASDVREFVYDDVFQEAERDLGVKLIYTLTDSETIPQDWRGKTGFISAQMIKTEVPDYKQRLFYIAGSHSMVTAMQDILLSLGIARHQIKTDFFPGYA